MLSSVWIWTEGTTSIACRWMIRATFKCTTLLYFQKYNKFLHNLLIITKEILQQNICITAANKRELKHESSFLVHTYYVEVSGNCHHLHLHPPVAQVQKLPAINQLK
jgi:hypothetical protein